MSNGCFACSKQRAGRSASPLKRTRAIPVEDLKKPPEFPETPLSFSGPTVAAPAAVEWVPSITTPQPQPTTGNLPPVVTSSTGSEKADFRALMETLVKAWNAPVGTQFAVPHGTLDWVRTTAPNESSPSVVTNMPVEMGFSASPAVDWTRTKPVQPFSATPSFGEAHDTAVPKEQHLLSNQPITPVPGQAAERMRAVLPGPDPTTAPQEQHSPSQAPQPPIEFRPAMPALRASPGGGIQSTSPQSGLTPAVVSHVPLGRAPVTAAPPWDTAPSPVVRRSRQSESPQGPQQASLAPLPPWQQHTALAPQVQNTAGRAPSPMASESRQQQQHAALAPQVQSILRAPSCMVSESQQQQQHIALAHQAQNTLERASSSIGSESQQQPQHAALAPQVQNTSERAPSSTVSELQQLQQHPALAPQAQRAPSPMASESWQQPQHMALPPQVQNTAERAPSPMVSESRHRQQQTALAPQGQKSVERAPSPVERNRQQSQSPPGQQRALAPHISNDSPLQPNQSSERPHFQWPELRGGGRDIAPPPSAPKARDDSIHSSIDWWQSVSKELQERGARAKAEAAGFQTAAKFRAFDSASEFRPSTDNLDFQANFRAAADIRAKTGLQLTAPTLL